MEWIAPILEQLNSSEIETPAFDTEVCALTALALLAHDQMEQSARWTRILTERQSSDGSVSMWGDDAFPKWTTSLAALAWSAARTDEYQVATQRAVDWILKTEGETQPRLEELGHDTTLVSWPWVSGTHGWVEPTAFHLLALKATGHGQHVRVQQGTAMLLDRQLPTGGCNYGNTEVLGQTLRSHVQPTGIAMLGLVGLPQGRIEKSLQYLQTEIRRSRTIDSFAWGLMGLAAHGANFPESTAILESVWEARSLTRTQLRQQALICLAARPDYLSSLVAVAAV